MATQGAFFSSVGEAEYANCSFNRNLYYSPNQTVALRFPAPGGAAGQPNNTAQVSAAAWQQSGHDLDSLFGVDPQFTDPLNLNFTLRPSSPAITKLDFKDWNHGDVGPQLPVGPTAVTLPSAATILPKKMDDDGGATQCTVGSCFAQLPDLCGAPISISSVYAAHFATLCDNPSLGSDFPNRYSYNPANSPKSALALALAGQNASTPAGFTRELLAQSWAAAVLDKSGGEAAGHGYLRGEFAQAPVWAQVRYARRWAARIYLLAADTTLDVSNKLSSDTFMLDAVTSSLLDRSTANSFAGFCGEAGNYLAHVINDAVTLHAPMRCCWNRFTQPCNVSSDCDSGGEGCVASGTKTAKYGIARCTIVETSVAGDITAHMLEAPPAVPYFLANGYPGYPDSGGLTHVLNTVPMMLDGKLIYATQDRCSRKCLSLYAVDEVHDAIALVFSVLSTNVSVVRVFAVVLFEVTSRTNSCTARTRANHGISEPC